MIKIAIITFTLLVSISFVGCSWFGASSQEDELINKHELYNAPLWVKTPSVKNSISTIGDSLKTEKSSFNTQKSEATLDAKTALKIELESKIMRLLNSYDTNQKIKKLHMLKVNDDIISGIMKNVKVTKLWRSDKLTIYVLAVVAIKDVKIEMEKMISNSFKNNQNIYQNFTLAKSNGSIDIALKN